MQLTAQTQFRLDLGSVVPGSASRVILPHPEIFAALHEGTELLLDDGKIRLRVDQCGADFAQTTVINGGLLSDRKCVPLSAMTEKDRSDLVEPSEGLRLSVQFRTRDLSFSGGCMGARPGRRAYKPASRSARNRLDQREMKRVSHPSRSMIASRDSPSSSIRISLARRASAARMVRLRVANSNCTRSRSVRFIFPMHLI